MRIKEFQLHHTGIKTTLLRCGTAAYLGFQLHHTGIKTKDASLSPFTHTAFQLHHTGIKTAKKDWCRNFALDFNCTIQELKHWVSTSYLHSLPSFQLHHTGIKTGWVIIAGKVFYLFQLHHTGIKTAFAREGWRGSPYISIAPYRN